MDFTHYGDKVVLMGTLAFMSDFVKVMFSLLLFIVTI